MHSYMYVVKIHTGKQWHGSVENNFPPLRNSTWILSCGLEKVKRSFRCVATLNRCDVFIPWRLGDLFRNLMSCQIINKSDNWQPVLTDVNFLMETICISALVCNITLKPPTVHPLTIYNREARD